MVWCVSFLRCGRGRESDGNEQSSFRRLKDAVRPLIEVDGRDFLRDRKLVRGRVSTEIKTGCPHCSSHGPTLSVACVYE